MLGQGKGFSSELEEIHVFHINQQTMAIILKFVFETTMGLGAFVFHFTHNS